MNLTCNVHPDQSDEIEQKTLNEVETNPLPEMNIELDKQEPTEDQEELRSEDFSDKKQNISLEGQTKDFLKTEKSEPCLTEKSVGPQKKESNLRKRSEKKNGTFGAVDKMAGGTKVGAKLKSSKSSNSLSLVKAPLLEDERSELRKADSVGGGNPSQTETPRKKSMEEWVDRLSVKKQKISVVDQIIEKKKKESLMPSHTVSADDLLDLEYHSVHATKSPLKRQEAFEKGSNVAEPQKLSISPLLTAQQMRQRRFIDTRPKSFDSAHLLKLRRPAQDVSEKELSLSTDEADYTDVQSLGRRKKSKSENLWEEHRFHDNQLGRHRKMGIRQGPSKTSLGESICLCLCW